MTPILLFLAATATVAGSSPAIVASAGAASVTTAEMEVAAHASIVRLQQFEYVAKRKAIEDVLFAKLLQQEARKQNITVTELRDREIVRKAHDVPEAEIVDLLQRAKGSLPENPKEARARVIEILSEHREQGIEVLYRRRLFARYGAEVLLPPPRLAVPISDADPLRGPVNAPVTIVVFSDFQCPGCRQARKMLAEVQGTYGDKVRLVYKQFPLPAHPDAALAAQASLCAADQGKFWQLHDWMFEHQDSLNADALSEAIDVDRETFSKCLSSGTHAADVDRDVKQGKELAVGATPTIFVNGREMMMNVNEDSVRDLVDEELRNARTSGTR